MFALRVATLCLCLSATAAIGYHKRLKFPSTSDVRDCITQVRPTKEEIRKIQIGRLPKTEAQNCLVTCIWRKAGMITENGLFVTENAIPFIMSKFKLPEYRREYVRRAVSNCLRFAAALDDECDYGGYMYKCTMIAFRGMKSHPLPKKKIKRKLSKKKKIK